MNDRRGAHSVAPVHGTGPNTYSGSGAPGSALGANADLYIDFATGNLYRKNAGHWHLEINIRGGAGAHTLTEVAVTGTGLKVTNGTGPVVKLALDLGSSPGQVADGGALAGAISGVATVTSAQTSTATTLSAHVANTNNPHGVTKAQIGLGNVTNDAQLKRATNEISSFTQKSAPTASDLLLVQDQAAGGALKYTTIASLVPTVQNALDFGSSPGQVADGGALADTIANVATVTSAQASTASSLSAHAADSSNPHCVTKAQIGLAKVTDDVQLKRAANEISSFTQKSAPTTSDLILVQDQAAGGALKYTSIGSLAPTIQLALDFGSSPGQVADGGALADTNASVATVMSAQASTASTLTVHAADSSNPHCVTKAQIGLANVTDDVQLKRAANELSSFTQKSAPATSDLILIQDQAAGGALKHSRIGSLVLPAHSSRDPIWDAPTTGSADDDEFTVDGLAAGTYTMYVDSTPLPSVCTRDGALDLTTVPAPNHYRSSVVGSTLYVQLRNGAACFMTKPFAGALSTEQWWMLGIGCPGDPGTASTNNPRAGLYFFKKAGSLPDQTNRGGVRMIQSVSRFETFGTVAGASNISGSGTLGEQSGWSTDGVVAWVKHGSAAGPNFSGFAFKRGGQIFTLPAATTPQYNGATDYVGIYLLSSLTNVPNPGVDSTLFAIHFLRRIPIAPGNWIAQP